ncbi:MAG TPA: hypothetical protein VFN21_12040, partial [Acidimicrobiales bacterium]|nr:hypothetical protein [Acidimicrobiales bacterium]
MSAWITTSGHARSRRRSALSMLAPLGILLAAVSLTGCRPNPVLQPVELPGSDWTSLVSMNASGLAV